MAKKAKNDPSSKPPLWALRDVTMETRNAVSIASFKEGKKIGKWVNDVLLKEAHRVLKGKQEVARVEDSVNLAEEIRNFAEGIRKIEQKIEQLDKPFWQKLFKK